jgi:hypothetical protein
MKTGAMAIVLLTIGVPVFAQDSRATDVTAVGPSAKAEATAGSEYGSVLERAGATVTIRAGLWSSTRELDSAGPFGAAMLWGKVTRPIGDRASFFAEGWTSLRGPFGAGDARGDLREAFVTFASGPIEVRAGRQIFAWGRADGINPTDNLTGQDLTLLAPDDSDRRLGAAALRFSYAYRDLTATAIWLPEFRPHRLPLPPLPGELDAPESEWRPEQFAIRIEQTGRAIDWSVSAFSGRDLNPDLGLSGHGLTLTHHGVRVVGADAAGNVGRFGVRAEAAYQWTDDRDGIDPFVKNPFLFVVVGADRTVHEHMNVNVQYLYRYVTHVESTRGIPPRVESLAAQQQAMLSSQMTSAQHGASARVSYKWLHDTLEAEIAGAGYVEPRGGVIRPKVTYAMSDRMKLLVGGEIYRGSKSVFDILRDNSGAFAEVRWSF